MKILAAWFCLGAAVFLLRFALKRPSANYAVASGALLGLAAWPLPAALAAVPLLAVPMLDRRWPLRARLHLVASGLLGLGALLLPWAISRV